MNNKLKETEAQRIIRMTTSIIAALGQYFDPEFKKVADALCAEHNLESLDRALCIDGFLVMTPDELVKKGFEWVALDSNGDVSAYKIEPHLIRCDCGRCSGEIFWHAPLCESRFLRSIDPVSNETAAKSMYFLGTTN